MTDKIRFACRLLAIGFGLGLPVIAQAQLNMTLWSSVAGGLEDIWGYSAGGEDYALCTTGSGLKIVNVTDPANPVVITTVPAIGSDLKDVKTYQNYAYCINQSGALQIIDLQLLPVSAATVGSFNSPTYNGAHNILIEGSYAFITKNGATPTDLRILSLANPTAPVEVGHFTHPDAGFVFADAHDCFVRDTFCYVANLSAGWTVLSIADITNPTLLARVSYPGNFSHSMWGDTSGNYLFTTDEVTEGHIRVWDISNLADITEVAEYTAAPNRIVHNCFVRGDFLYISYYGEGVKVLDIGNPEIPVEVGSYDTSPGGTTGFVGCWGVYPYFASGNIIASDLGTGLNVLSFAGTRAGYVVGQVTNMGTGFPLDGVDVAVVQNQQTKMTDPSGDYALGAVPGNYDLVFEKFTFAPDTVQVTITAGGTLTVNVALVPLAGADLVGTVKRSVCGTAVAGAAVSVIATAVPPGLTDGAGAYNVGFLPAATYSVAAARFGFLPAESTVTVVAGPANMRDFELEPGVQDDAEFNQGWSLGVLGDDATTGIWERVDPNGTVGSGFVQPEDDHTAAGTFCFVTGQSGAGAGIGANDVDGGTTTLRTPVFSLANFIEPTLEYWRWYTNNQGAEPNADSWIVQISDDGGSGWVTLENTTVSANSWQQQTFNLIGLVEPTESMLLQFVASDLAGGSVVEAGVDDVRIVENGVYGDFTDDNVVTASDIIANVDYIFKGGSSAMPELRSDADGNCTVTAGDIIYLVNYVFKGGPEPSVPCLCGT